MSGPSLGSILATRQGSLLLAFLCAVCAAGVLVFALGRYKSNVQQPVPQATVLVSTGEIAKGMTGAQISAAHLVKPLPVAATAVSPGALTDASSLTAATASTTILPGTQLTSADFATVLDVGQVLNSNQRALEINVSGAQGAVDITQPSSRVDAYVTTSSDGTSSGTSTVASGSPPGGSNGGTSVLKATVGPSPTATSLESGVALIDPNMLVLKPATATAVSLGNQLVAGSTLVVAVPNSKVRLMIAAASSGSLYLALRPSTKPAPANPTTPKAAQ
jgi:Flp pilus assembly protein CpaB